MECFDGFDVWEVRYLFLAGPKVQNDGWAEGRAALWVDEVRLGLGSSAVILDHRLTRTEEFISLIINEGWLMVFWIHFAVLICTTTSWILLLYFIVIMNWCFILTNAIPTKILSYAKISSIYLWFLCALVIMINTFLEYLLIKIKLFHKITISLRIVFLNLCFWTCSEVLLGNLCFGIIIRKLLGTFVNIWFIYAF